MKGFVKCGELSFWAVAFSLCVQGSGPRTSSLLSPRMSRTEVSQCAAAEYTCTEVEVRVERGGERLGMELNAYNQILSFQSGGPTDRHPDMLVNDRILGVDGQRLENRMLTDVLVPAQAHRFILERWVPPSGMESTRQLSPRTLLGTRHRTRSTHTRLRSWPHA